MEEERYGIVRKKESMYKVCVPFYYSETINKILEENHRELRLSEDYTFADAFKGFVGAVINNKKVRKEFIKKDPEIWFFPFADEFETFYSSNCQKDIKGIENEKAELKELMKEFETYIGEEPSRGPQHELEMGYNRDQCLFSLAAIQVAISDESVNGKKETEFTISEETAKKLERIICDEYLVSCGAWVSKQLFTLDDYKKNAQKLYICGENSLRKRKEIKCMGYDKQTYKVPQNTGVLLTIPIVFRFLPSAKIRWSDLVEPAKWDTVQYAFFPGFRAFSYQTVEKIRETLKEAFPNMKYVSTWFNSVLIPENVDKFKSSLYSAIENEIA